MRAAIDEVVSGASDKSVVALSADTETYGVILPENSKLTFDLNGHEYLPVPDANGDYAGSGGTKTQAMQLLKGSKVVIKNSSTNDGIITGNNTANKKTKMVIQNYSNLTLEDVTVMDAGNDGYVLSNNFGEIHLKGKTKIIAQDNHVAFDLWYGLSDAYLDGVIVYIDDPTVEIQGVIEFGRHSGRSVEDWIEKTHLYVCEGYDLSKLSIRNSSSVTTPEVEFSWSEPINGYHELIVTPL